MARGITPEEEKLVVDMVARARAAMEQIKDYDQARVDRLCQAIGWATGNEKTFVRIAQMGVDESGIGDREGRAGKRFKVHRRAARRAAPKKRRRHRGSPKEGHRQDTPSPPG